MAKLNYAGFRPRPKQWKDRSLWQETLLTGTQVVVIKGMVPLSRSVHYRFMAESRSAGPGKNFCSKPLSETLPNSKTVGKQPVSAGKLFGGDKVIFFPSSLRCLDCGGWLPNIIFGREISPEKGNLFLQNSPNPKKVFPSGLTIDVPGYSFC